MEPIGTNESENDMPHTQLSNKERIARYFCILLSILAIIEFSTALQGVRLLSIVMRSIIIIGLLLLANEPRLLFLNFSDLLSEKGDPINTIGRLLSYAMMIAVIILAVVIFYAILQG